MIAAERQRQIEQEGWTTGHDDEHAGGDLAMAAAAYAIHDANGCPFSARGYALWPFSGNEWKPQGQIRNLVRAGALIAAEIDRLARRLDAEEGDAESTPWTRFDL